MKGYVYLDNDRNLNFRDWKYINEENPYFWSENSHLIDTVWIVDTDNSKSIEDFLFSIRKRELSITAVREMCNILQFDLDAFISKNSHRIKPNVQ